ncbi:unnamed protein product, partial [Mesorhabditis spiculigera]
MIRSEDSSILWSSGAIKEEKDPFDELFQEFNNIDDPFVSSPQTMQNNSPFLAYPNPSSPELQPLEPVKIGDLRGLPRTGMMSNPEHFTWDAPMPDAMPDARLPYLDNRGQPDRRRCDTLAQQQQHESFDSNNSEDDFFNQPTHDRRSVSFGGTSQFARRFNKHNVYNPNLLVVRSQSGRFVF